MIHTALTIKKYVPPSNLLPWLTHKQMLTKKLNAITRSTRLKVLTHKIEPTNWWDNCVCGLGKQQALHREILTYSGDDSCWYARTIIPQVTLENHHSVFARLSTETLGDLIFGEYDICRKSLVYYPINADSIEYYWLDTSLLANRKLLWARLSEFTIKMDHFYLLEIFLPGLEKYI